MFTIHDSAAGAYLAPFFLHAEGIAIRTFTDCVNDPDHAFGRNPKDYTLMCLGTFDDTKAQITLLQTMKPLGNGLSFLSPKNDTDQHQLPLEVVKS